MEVKYFLRWSEKKYCWEICSIDDRAGYEPKILGHLSLGSMSRLIESHILPNIDIINQK
jgi:hypothetical protein